MPALEFFIVSESVSVDQATSRISIFNVLEDVRAAALPAAFSAVATGSWMVAQEEYGREFVVTFRVHGPGLALPDTEGRFVANDRRHRMVATFGLQLAAAGDWIFEVLLNGQRAATHTMTVAVAPMPSISPQAPPLPQ